MYKPTADCKAHRGIRQLDVMRFVRGLHLLHKYSNIVAVFIVNTNDTPHISIYYLNIQVDSYVSQTFLIYHTENFKSLVLKIQFLRTFIVILNNKLCFKLFFS